MSLGPFPEFVDAYQVFSHRTHVSALVPLTKLQRFSQYLVQEETVVETPEVSVELEFDKDASGYRTVKGQLGAKVRLECQRCLQPLSYALAVRPDLIVMDTDQNARQLEDEREVVLTQIRDEHKILDVLALVEDELILGLPLAPRHTEGECKALPVKRVAGASTAPRGISGDDEGIRDKLMALKATLAKTEAKSESSSMDSKKSDTSSDKNSDNSDENN